MRRSTRKIAILGAALFFVGLFTALTYALLWGKLFPFSPIILDFSRHELTHVVIYIEDGNRFSDFDWVDTLLPRVEEFHGLRFKAKPKIFLFADSATYFKRSISTARLCAFYNGAIVVSPWAQTEYAEGKISLYVYLRHELSHSILYQNMNIFRAMRYPRWLLEGIATYSANQMGTSFYPGKEETFALIRQGNWMPPEYYETSKEMNISLNVGFKPPFMYSQFACIVDELIARYGREAFLNYMRRLMTNSNHNTIFKKSFGMDFDTFLASFKTGIEAVPKI